MYEARERIDQYNVGLITEMELEKAMKEINYMNDKFYGFYIRNGSASLLVNGAPDGWESV